MRARASAQCEIVISREPGPLELPYPQLVSRRLLGVVNDEDLHWALF
jgi:hypothetical protein